MQGHLKVEIIDLKTGKSEIVYDKRNTLKQEYLDAYADLCDPNEAFSNMSMDNPFTEDAYPTNGKDGIVIDDGSGTWYGLDCNIWVAGTTVNPNFVCEGFLTGKAMTIPAKTNVRLGFNWQTNAFTVQFAQPSTWSSLSVTDIQQLKINWTIDFNV